MFLIFYYIKINNIDLINQYILNKILFFLIKFKRKNNYFILVFRIIIFYID
jgi:hypothetical protein